MQTATSHHLSLSSLKTQVNETNFLIFKKKRNFMKTAAEAIYFSFLASLATVILQHILLQLALYICLSRGVKHLSCRIVNPIKGLGCC